MWNWRTERAKRARFEAELLPHLGALYRFARVRSKLPAKPRTWCRSRAHAPSNVMPATALQTNARAWLFTILRNELVSRRRRLDRARSLESERAPSPPTRWPTASSFCSLDRRWSEEIRTALASVAERYRTPVYLKDVEGFSYREIADVLLCPLGTVMSRLRARPYAVAARCSSTRRPSVGWCARAPAGVDVSSSFQESCERLLSGVDVSSADCHALRLWIAAYVDDELGVDAAIEVERHLDACAARRRAVGRQRHLMRGLRELYPVEEPPPGLADRIRFVTLGATTVPRRMIAVAGAVIVVGSVLGRLGTSLWQAPAHDARPTATNAGSDGAGRLGAGGDARQRTCIVVPTRTCCRSR